MAAKVWYQSFVHPVEQRPYIDRLQARLDRLADPGVRFEVKGMDPPDHLFHPLTEFRCAAQAIRAGFEAERGGYDAFVIGHFQEPGLLEARSSLGIPTVGLGEANLLTACTLGRSIGLVTIDPIFVPWHQRQVAEMGLTDRVVGVRPIHADLPGFMRAFTDEAAYQTVRAEFVEQVRPLVADGAEVILPAGGLPMLLLSRETPFTIDGALVLDGVATVVLATQMALGLRRLTGAVASRRSTYAPPPPGCIEEFVGSRW